MNTRVRIYIVEDEAIIAMELREHLRALGYEVCGHAAQGETALREIPHLLPDLVLMDVNLGRGISGIDVASELRQRFPLEVVFVTAYTTIAQREADSGGALYLAKPFNQAGLRKVIRQALSAGSP